MSDLVKKVYIEDISARILVKMIADEDRVLFKHKDCSMTFVIEDNFLYAFDADNFNENDEVDNDLFRHRGVAFTDVIRDFYGNTHHLLLFLQELASEGLVVELSDLFQHDTLSIDGYIAEVKRYQENQ